MNTRRSRRNRINESRKVTLTLGQLKRLVKESNKGGFRIKNRCLIKYLVSPSRDESDVVIPNGVVEIGPEAFIECFEMQSVTITSSVKEIGYKAFAYSGLKSVTIPSSVTNIGPSAFRSCGKLDSVTIGNGVTSIGRYAFSYCPNITSITIPSSVTSIGDCVFVGCSGLQRIVVANEEQKDMILNGYNDLPKSVKIIVKGESSEEELNESRKVTLTIGQLRKLVRESEEDNEGQEIYGLYINDMTDYEEDEDGFSENIPEEIYYEEFDDSDEAWNKAEELVDEYRNKEGDFRIEVFAGIYKDEDGDIDTDSMYSIFCMNSGTRGYQGHINMA